MSDQGQLEARVQHRWDALLADPALVPLAAIAEECAGAFLRQPEDAIYRELPDAVLLAWGNIRASSVPNAEARFWQLVVLCLIRKFDPARHRHRLPDVLVKQYRKSFARLVENMESTGFDWFDANKDIALKELGVCSGLLIPAGSRVLELRSGWSRRILLSNGWMGALRVFAFMLQGGRRNFPWYEMHVHLGILDEFNPEGWRATLHRIAELLELNPDMQGAFVGGWLYDPQLATVTPHLAFFRDIGLQSGARLFRVGIDTSGDAFAKSKSRAKLHSEGKYTPIAHLLIWPRRDLLRWAGKLDGV